MRNRDICEVDVIYLLRFVSLELITEQTIDAQSCCWIEACISDGLARKSLQLVTLSCRFLCYGRALVLAVVPCRKSLLIFML